MLQQRAWLGYEEGKHILCTMNKCQDICDSVRDRLAVSLETIIERIFIYIYIYNKSCIHSIIHFYFISLETGNKSTLICWGKFYSNS